MKLRPIIHRSYELGDDVYSITIEYADEEHERVTAAWRRISDGKTWKLGYGVRTCAEAMNLAERAVEKNPNESSPRSVFGVTPV